MNSSPPPDAAELLVTDGHPAYRLFARASGIAHRALNLAAGGWVAGELHVQKVSAYHSRFKQWLRRFHGVASRYLAQLSRLAMGARPRTDRLAANAAQGGVGTLPTSNGDIAWQR